MGKTTYFVRKYPAKVSSSDSVHSQSRQLTIGYHRSTSGTRIDHAKKIDDFRVIIYKPESAKRSRKSSGKYTNETSRQVQFYLFTYADQPNRIYRQDKTQSHDGIGLKPPVCILEKIDNQWFPTTVLRQSEMEALRAFTGSDLLDPDNAIANKRAIKKVGYSGSVHPTDKSRIEKHQNRVASHTPKKRKVSIR